MPTVESVKKDIEALGIARKTLSNGYYMPSA